MPNRIARFAERLLRSRPASSPARDFRAELAFAFAAMQLVSCLLVGSWELFAGSARIGYTVLAAMLPLAAVLVWLRRGANAELAGTVVVAMLYLLLLILNLGSAGRAAGVNIVMPVFALFAVLVSSPRGALLWLLLIAVNILLARHLRETGYPPLLVPDPSSMASAIDRLPLLLSVPAALIGLLIQRAMSRFGIQLEQARQEETRARETATENARRFADFADIAADGFWETDPELRFTYFSPSFERTVGSGVKSLIGLTPEQAYRSQYPDAPDLSGYMEPLRRQQPYSDQLLQMRDSRGQTLWLLSDGHPQFDDRGRFRGYRGVVHDITRQRGIEQSLRDSEQRLRTITDNLPALISYIDTDRVFRFNNRTYEIWLKRPLSEITGRRLVDVFTPDTYSLIEPHLLRALSGEETSFELDLNATRDRHVRVTYVPDRDGSGSVVGVYGLIHDLTELKRVEKELRYLSQFDPLTGLANRRRFDERHGEAIARSERSGQPMALLFIDLDQFKSINDSLGHKAGDMALHQFAQLLLQCVRQTDTVARLSGDEFVIVLESLTSSDAAVLVAEKVLRLLEQTPFDLSGTLRTMSASIGVAVRAPRETDAEALLRRADRALYLAKAAGRGTYREAPPAQVDQPGSRSAG